ncbi:hypothetical protein [Polyangium sp. 6x1]|uniref:hypothetical protein n=1 Tax=Polyangium sp. 6x1 TaxID=3042689 RepID=UPI002482856D|nr:hypothetical protein [Polyangium sp. 6x1]MDI1450889.1 hypothetical protein [Polyangium sp. 6x1]
MTTQYISALVLSALVASLSAGCGNAASSGEACVEAPALAGDHVYVFSAGSVPPVDDAGLVQPSLRSAPQTPRARVERTVRSDGSETLSGVSQVAAMKVMEYAELGPDGRLVYADVTATGANGETRRLIADAAHGAFYVQDERGAGWMRMAKDTPWVYAGLAGDTSFAPLPTPVSAWVTLRATSASPDVRVLDATTREGRIVPQDQLVAEGEGDERLVIAGDTVLTANDDFVTALGEDTLEPLRIPAVTLRPRRVAQR